MAVASGSAPTWVGVTDDEGDRRDRLDHAYETKVCEPADLFEIGAAKPDSDPKMIAEQFEDLAGYLASFAAPVQTPKGNYACLHCGEVLMGNVAENLFGKGGFEWGLAHGEGHCRACHWPARLYHTVRDRHGEIMVEFNAIVLQYMPMTPEEYAAQEAQDT